MKQSLDKLNQLAEQVANEKGLRVYDLELVGSGNGKILRIYIDRTDGSGISLEDCSKFSGGFSALTDDQDDLIEGNFYLEVSSPGVERALKKTWHYAESVGQKIFVNLNQPLAELQSEIAPAFAAQKKLTATVKSLKDQKLELEFEGGNIVVPLENVIKAHVVYDFQKKQEKP